MLVRFVAIGVALLGFCLVGAAEPSDERATAGSGEGHARVVLERAPVEETAAALRELFAGGGDGDGESGLKIEVKPEERAIELTGHRATVASVRKMLGEIDAGAAPSGRSALIELAIFEVMVPVEDVAMISQEKLSDAAGTEEGLATLLASMGESRLVHRLSERVPFDRETEIKYSFPPTSQPIEQLQGQARIQELARPERVQETIRIWPRSTGVGSIRVRSEGLANRLSGLELGNGTKCAMGYKSEHDWSGPILWGRAEVMLTTGAAGEESSKDCISVVRFVVRDSQ